MRTGEATVEDLVLKAQLNRVLEILGVGADLARADTEALRGLLAEIRLFLTQDM